MFSGLSFHFLLSKLDSFTTYQVSFPLLVGNMDNRGFSFSKRDIWPVK